MSADEDRPAEIERLREGMAQVRADPELRRIVDEAPPLSEHARHVIAWAFRAPPESEGAA